MFLSGWHDAEEATMEMHGRGGTFGTVARILAALLLLALLVPSAACSQLGLTGNSSSSEQVAQPVPQLLSQSSTGKTSAGAGVGSAGLPAGSSDSVARSAAPAATNVASRQQMIIRNANMRLEVAKVSDAIDKLRAIAKKYSALIAGLAVSTDQSTVVPQPAQPEGQRSTLSSGQPYNGTVTVLVPVAKFDSFVDEVRATGKLLTYSTDDRNVTQEHLDLTARLDNLKAEEARLRTFFANAHTVSDMLAIETELTRVQGQIESMSAQLTYLERQAAMATLTVELVEPKALVRPSGVDWGFGSAITTSVRAFVGMINIILIFIGAVLPLVIIGLAVFFVVRWQVRRARARRTATPEATPQRETDRGEQAAE